MALTNPWDKGRPNLVSKKRYNRRKGEKRRREKRRKGRGREEEEKPSKPRYGITWAFKALKGFPCNYMVIILPQT